MIATGPVAGRAQTAEDALESPRGRRRRQQHELERVLGTNALFATAYGNVGSSIYYALGVTAFFALGLTPVVFVIAGLFFAAHRGDLRGGNGPLSRRRAARRASRGTRSTSSCSFGAAWAQMLNYVDHDRHLGVLRAALPLDLLGAAAENPWDIVGGAS